MAGLPPPPIQDKPGSFTWLEWYRQLRNYISTSGSVPWYIINFAGSNITDIAIRLHNSLQGLQGGTAGEMYHLTNAEHTAVLDSTQGTWSPTFTNLTVVNGTGAATYAGRYSRIGRTIFYTVKISCSGTATTASTAGTTYCDLPVAAAQDDIVVVSNKTTLLGVGAGLLDSTNDRCYPSSWVATGNTIIISGKYEV